MRIIKKKVLLIFSVVCLLCLFLLLESHLADPYAIVKSESLQAPNFKHLFGTDYLGRDLFSRLLYGSLNSLWISFCALSLVVIISSILGGVSGLLGGLVDSIMTTFADIIISVPSTILALVFTGLFANSIATVMLALSISWSGNYIRYIRNLVLNIKKEEFIILAPLNGSTGKHTLLHHIFPNIFTKLASLFLTDIGKIMLSISGLSFLGIGVQPPTPELGTILYDGKAYFFIAPWLFIFPGILLSGFMLITQYFGKKINTIYGGNL